jgi:hypothetical protein
MRVTPSIDDRPIDGAVATQWMAAVLDLLRRPPCILS